MALFAVLMPSPQQKIAETIKSTFPQDHLALNDTQWLVSTTGTVVELTAKLGIYDATQPQKASTGNAVIVAVSAYFGRGPTSVWDWIKAKLESGSGA